ncbi:MAG: hypothetical protein GY856_03150 [bacterium]|nr:hypothetical protein [bacterium]
MCVYPDDPSCFPLATQRVQTGVGHLSFPFDHGWCHLNLNFPDDAVTGDVDFPVLPPGTIAQSHVSVVHSVPGLHAGGLQAVELAQACEKWSPRVTAIFTAGFETGDTGAWSNTVP